MSQLNHYRPLFRSPFLFGAGLHGDLNRLFDSAVATGETTAVWAPAVDIHEDAEGFTLRAEVAGLSAKDIDISIENDTLTLKGERKLEREDNKDGYRRIERSFGSFTRSFALPKNVDTERVKAESKNGVLTVTLPRREETKPKQIKVQIDG